MKSQNDDEAVKQAKAKSEVGMEMVNEYSSARFL